MTGYRRWFAVPGLVLTLCLGVTAGEAAAVRQLLVVSSAYWGKDHRTFTFDVFDLDDGGKRIHRAGPADVGEIRGMACTPATQRLYVSGHEGLVCYSWPEREVIWRRPVEGGKTEQNDAIAIAPDGTGISTIRHFGLGMNVYDAQDGKRLRVIHEDRMPKWGRFSQFSHDGKRLFASNCDGKGGAVFVIDPATDAILFEFKPVWEPVRFALSPDGARFVYATGPRRSLGINSTVDGKLLCEIPVTAPAPAEAGGKGRKKQDLRWLALSPDGATAWACDAAGPALHRFDLAAEPPVHAGTAATATGKPEEGLMYSVDGRFLVTGSGAILDPSDGKTLGHLVDEGGKPCKASNSMLALEVDAAGKILRTNQQCAPAWPVP